MSTESFRHLGAQLSNWGRWGPDDQLGTLNLISPEMRRDAARLVRRGAVFSLGIPFSANGPQTGGIRNNPVHLMSATGEGQMHPGGFCYADDLIIMPLQAATQWDALSHGFYDDRLYNGYPATEVTVKGAAKNAIDRLVESIVGRGVLLDVARLHGVDHLQMGHVITASDLDACTSAQGVEVRAGDIVCVRTGWRQVFTAHGAGAFKAGEPGLGLDTAVWLRERDVAALACDNYAVEVMPSESGDYMPLHCVLIRDMGLTLGEMFDLEALADDCAADSRYEFFMSAPPLAFERAVGSPVNPIAIK